MRAKGKYYPRTGQHSRDWAHVRIKWAPLICPRAWNMCARPWVFGRKNCYHDQIQHTDPTPQINMDHHLGRPDRLAGLWHPCLGAADLEVRSQSDLGLSANGTGRGQCTGARHSKTRHTQTDPGTDFASEGHLFSGQPASYAGGPGRGSRACSARQCHQTRSIAQAQRPGTRGTEQTTGSSFDHKTRLQGHACRVRCHPACPPSGCSWHQNTGPCRGLNHPCHSVWHATVCVPAASVLDPGHDRQSG